MFPEARRVEGLGPGVPTVKDTRRKNTVTHGFPGHREERTALPGLEGEGRGDEKDQVFRNQYSGPSLPHPPPCLILIIPFIPERGSIEPQACSGLQKHLRPMPQFGPAALADRFPEDPAAAGAAGEKSSYAPGLQRARRKCALVCLCVWRGWGRGAGKFYWTQFKSWPISHPKWLSGKISPPELGRNRGLRTRLTFIKMLPNWDYLQFFPFYFYLLIDFREGGLWSFPLLRSALRATSSRY